MGMISEILKKVRDPNFSLIVLSLLLLITPGFLTIFFLQNDLFLSLDISKLLFLSIAFISPLVLINMMLVSMTLFRAGEPPSKEELFISFLLGIIISGVVFYGALFIFFWEDGTEPNEFIKTISLVEVLTCFFIPIFERIVNKKKGKKE